MNTTTITKQQPIFAFGTQIKQEKKQEAKFCIMTDNHIYKFNQKKNFIAKQIALSGVKIHSTMYFENSEGRTIPISDEMFEKIISKNNSFSNEVGIA